MKEKYLLVLVRGIG